MNGAIFYDSETSSIVIWLRKLLSTNINAIKGWNLVVVLIFGFRLSFKWNSKLTAREEGTDSAWEGANTSKLAALFSRKHVPWFKT